MARIKSFSEISSFDYTDQLLATIKKDIESKGKEYILGVNEEEYKNSLISKYILELLVVNYSSEYMGQPSISKEWREDFMYRERYESDVYSFTIRYNYTGSSVLFRIRPNNYIMTSTDIDVSDTTVSFGFKLYKKDAEEFKRTKNDYLGRAFSNVENANIVAKNWNNSLPGYIHSYFDTQKKKYQEENDFFEAISVNTNKGTEILFTPPTIKKPIIPQPKVDSSKKFSTAPTMDTTMYEDVLKVIYAAGKSMEKKPSLYQGKDEEGLRDQFLFHLETRYEATTATGETFNRSGKTDILLKYANDNSNLFVAECKFWHGASEFHSAISQLFDRYLTWRDSKTALIFFVKNKDFTNTLSTIKLEVKEHPYYLKENGTSGESSFGYLFRLPQDPAKLVYFEIMAFHYDK